MLWLQKPWQTLKVTDPSWIRLWIDAQKTEDARLQLASCISFIEQKLSALHPVSLCLNLWKTNTKDQMYAFKAILQIYLQNTHWCLFPQWMHEILCRHLNCTKQSRNTKSAGFRIALRHVSSSTLVGNWKRFSCALCQLAELCLFPVGFTKQQEWRHATRSPTNNSHYKPRDISSLGSVCESSCEPWHFPIQIWTKGFAKINSYLKSALISWVTHLMDSKLAGVFFEAAPPPNGAIKSFHVFDLLSISISISTGKSENFVPQRNEMPQWIVIFCESDNSCKQRNLLLSVPLENWNPTTFSNICTYCGSIFCGETKPRRNLWGNHPSKFIVMFYLKKPSAFPFCPLLKFLKPQPIFLSQCQPVSGSFWRGPKPFQFARLCNGQQNCVNPSVFKRHAV